MSPQLPSHSSLRTASTEVTISSESIDKKFMIDFPFVARRPSGISYIFVEYTFPRFVKKSRSLCVDVVRSVFTTSSSFVLRSTTPTPPRFCVLYSPGFVRFTYPPCVSTNTLSSSGTKSSAESAFTPPFTIFVRRSSPNFSAIVASSSLTICIIFFLLLRIDSSSLMSACTSLSSSSIFLRSNPASFCSRISRIACACTSENLNSFINCACAVGTSFAARMSLMILSIWSSAFLRPSKMCSRSCALVRSYCVRRLTTSARCLMYSSRITFSDSVCGTPSTSATML